MNENYWLYDWLDENGIADAAALRLALDSRSLVANLQDSARQWAGEPTSLPSECNLIAGSGMGGYNGLTCITPSCRFRRIDVLYRHAWHYFDYIYLPDGAGDLLRGLDETPDDDDLDDLAKLIETAMHLRNIGAASLTRYYSSGALESPGLIMLDGGKWDKIWQEMEREFQNDKGSYEIFHCGAQKYQVCYNDTKLQYSPSITLNVSRIPKSERARALRDALALNMVNRHRKALTLDLTATKRLGGSLGSTIWSHQWAKSRIGTVDDGEVFFEMEFPSLENVPISDLIAVRLGERDSFEACRTALRKAAQEISTTTKSGRDAVSAQIVRDVVVPEVAKLRMKLDAARMVLAKKSAIALSVAAVSTWCGVHFGIGVLPSIGAGTIAAFSTGLKDAASKYSEERRDLEISDMSFLWKAMKCVDK